MSQFGYSGGGNGANGWRTRGFFFQSFDSSRDGSYRNQETPRRFDMPNDKQNSNHRCHPITMDGEGRMITGIPLSCPPNVKCNVQDYSMDYRGNNVTRYRNEMHGEKDYIGGIPNNHNVGRRGGFPQGMFKKLGSIGWKTPSYGGDNRVDSNKYIKEWKEELAQNGVWTQTQSYPGKNGWENGQGNGQPTAQGKAGFIDSREAAKRYSGRVIC